MFNKYYMKAVLHWSMRKHYDKFKEINNIFSKAWIKIIAPQISEILSNNNGFVISKWDDPTKSYVELESNFLVKSASLNHSNDFSYIINPEWYIWTSAAFELGKLLSMQKRIYSLEEITDPPALLPKNYVYSPKQLTDYIKKHWSLPIPEYNQESLEMLKNMITPLIAVWWIIENHASKAYKFWDRIEKELWFIQKDTRGWQYTLLWGTKSPNESDSERLKKEFEEQLWVSEFFIKNLIVSFMETLNSWYQNVWISRQFIDYILSINNPPKKENWIRLPKTIALKELSLENNAIITLKKYSG